MTKEKAQKVLEHLIRTGQGFCFVDGVVVDRMSAELIASGGEAE
ncbi:MAG: hypothetical protein Q7S52_05410 [bacterium]|nr:hypothetical protein [bacterium]